MTKPTTISSWNISSSSSTLSSSSSHSTESAAPSVSCSPTLQLVGAVENGFNNRNSPFSIKINNDCGKFDVDNTTALANYAPIDGLNITVDEISIPGLSFDYVLLSIFALNNNGTPVIKAYQLHFGAIDMPILLLQPDGQPASGVTVSGSATAYSGVSESCVTDSLGQCVLSNLPATTIALVATTPDNSIAINGLAATVVQVTLQLIPFHTPNNSSSFDIANGTTGWTGGQLTKSLKIKRDTTLVVSTNGQFDLQTAFSSFSVHPFTKKVFIKYKFITAEVPGGFFG